MTKVVYEPIFCFHKTTDLIVFIYFGAQLPSCWRLLYTSEMACILVIYTPRGE